MDPLVPPPEHGRTFSSRRRVRLSDMDATGRLRLDAVARYLQDVAGDDVDETGWGAPEHLWVVRCIRLDVLAPPLDDRAVEVTTWCSGEATVAAGRRWSLSGDRGGRIEVDSVWIHLGPDARPARLEGFGVYAGAAAGRVVSTKLHLPDPPRDAPRAQWPLRVTDLDVLGHLNNAAYWHAVEQQLAVAGPDPRRPFRAQLDYRRPIDLVDRIDLVEFDDGGAYALAFLARDATRAVARLEQLDG